MKHDIESILVVNKYFTKMKLDNACCKKTELVRRYMTKKIEKTLTVRKNRFSTIKFLLSSILTFI